MLRRARRTLSTKKGAGDLVPVGRDGLELRGRLGERDLDDPVAVERRHRPEPSLVDALRGTEAIAGREDTVARRRRAAALDVAQHRHPCLEARSRLDLARED